MDLERITATHGAGVGGEGAAAHAGTFQSSVSAGNWAAGKPYASSKDEAIHCQGKDASARAGAGRSNSTTAKGA